jgi:hypothetical protein
MTRLMAALWLLTMILTAYILTGCSNIPTLDEVAGERSKPVYVKGTVYRW